jgi:hypothetical protein
MMQAPTYTSPRICVAMLAFDLQVSIFEIRKRRKRFGKTLTHTFTKENLRIPRCHDVFQIAQNLTALLIGPIVKN